MGSHNSILSPVKEIAMSKSRGISKWEFSDGNVYAVANRHYCGGNIRPGMVIARWDADFDDCM